MDRILEPELMDDPEQAAAYAATDFSQENQGFVQRFEEYFPGFSSGRVLDAGCGPADIPIRFARRYSNCQVMAVDASLPMIKLAEQAIAADERNHQQLGAILDRIRTERVGRRARRMRGDPSLVQRLRGAPDQLGRNTGRHGVNGLEQTSLVGSQHRRTADTG